MRARTKVAIVGAGYLAALLLAAAAVALNVAWTSGADRQASSGMFAFGDSLLFLAAFGAASVPPTVAGLVFLRPQHSFWRVLAVAALVIAATGLAAFAVCLAGQAAGASPALRSSSLVAVFRILIAPLAALAFLLSAAIAPLRGPRLALCGATLSEVVVFALWLLRLPR
jgi:hypothetical protein